MAHGWNTDHHSKTPSDPKTWEVSLDPEESFIQHTEQLTEEHNMISEDIPTSDLNCLSPAADSLQNACLEPPWQEKGEMVEPDNQLREVKVNQMDVAKNDPCVMEAYSQEALQNTLSSLEGYSDISSCSDADLDGISDAALEENTNASAECQNITEETNELEKHHSTLCNADVLQSELSKKDFEDKTPYESACKNGNSNTVMDDCNQEERIQNQCSSNIDLVTEGDDKGTLNEEEMEQMAGPNSCSCVHSTLSKRQDSENRTTKEAVCGSRSGQSNNVMDNLGERVPLSLHDQDLSNSALTRKGEDGDALNEEQIVKMESDNSGCCVEESSEDYKDTPSSVCVFDLKRKVEDERHDDGDAHAQSACQLEVVNKTSKLVDTEYASNPGEDLDNLNEEQMEKMACNNSGCCVEESSEDYKDTPSSVCVLDSKRKVEDEKHDDDGDAHAQSACQLEVVNKTSKLADTAHSSIPDSENTDPDKELCSNGTECSVTQEVERSSFEFLQSCFGFKDTEYNQPAVYSVVHTKLDQHEMHSSACESQNSQNCDVRNPQPPVLLKATFGPINEDQTEKENDGMEEPPLLSAYCNAQGSLETTQHNDCLEGQMIKPDFAGMDSENVRRLTSEISLISSQKLMKKLQPVVLVDKTEQKNVDGNVYHCSKCGKNSQSSDEIIEHYHCKHVQCSFQHCVTCGCYLSNQTLAEHFCDQIKPYQVLAIRNGPDCATLKEHARKRNPKYICRYCKKVFVKMPFYLDHEKRHRDVTEHRCGCCGLYFPHSSKLEGHKRKTKCMPLILEPNREVQETSEVNCKKAHTPFLLGSDGCQVKLHDCFVKLVDMNKKKWLPQTIHCPVCGKTFRLRAQLKSHLRSHTDEKPFKCNKCKKEFKYSWNLNKHKREQCSQERRIQTSLEENRKLPGRFQCPLCPRVFKYSYNTSRHLREQCLKEYTLKGKGKVGNHYECPLCRERFTMACNRNRHLKNICFQRYKFKVIVKKREYAKVLKEEVKAEMEEKGLARIASKESSPFKCKLCPARFKHKSGVYRHMRIHRKDANPSEHKQTISDNQGHQSKGSSEIILNQPFSCRFCEKCFSSAPSLKKHLQKHVGKKPFRCLLCGKNFSRHGHLIAHKNVHKQKIECSVCKAVLPTIRDLLKHRQSHIKKGMLKCPDCPMQFKYPVFLLRHVAKHVKKIKPKSTQPPHDNQCADKKVNKIYEDFSCKLCQKEFADSKALSEHCKVHMPKNTSVSRCQFCKRQFQCRGGLIRHIRVHTGEKPYPCVKCGRHFPRKEYLKIHEEKCIVLQEKPPPPPSNSPQTLGKSEAVAKIFKCSHCPHVFTMSSSLKVHERAHMANSLSPCTKCRKYYRNRKIKEHQKNCKGSVSEHPCRNCGAIFSVLKVRNVHERKCKVVTSKVSETTIKDKFKEKCPYCSKRFQFKCYLLRHMRSHTKQDSNVHCIKKNEGQHQYLQHEASQILNDSRPKFMLRDASNLKDSRVVVGINGELKCSFCTKTFTKPRNLRRHILTHTDVKPYRCKACESSFSRFDHLKLHQAHCKGKKQRLEVRIEKINVELFGKSWQTKMQQPNEFECDVCSKQFSTQSNLNRHISMLHSTFKPFSCKRCGNSYTSKKSLKRHVLTVNCKRSSGENLKPSQSNTVQSCRETSKLLQRIQGHYSSKFKFNCEYCPRRFKNLSQMKVHTRLHTGDKPFGCASCGERFIRRDYLQRHLIKCSGRRRDGLKVFCDGCGGLFTQEALRIHQKNCLINFKSQDSLQTTSVDTVSEMKGFSCISCSDHFLLFSQLQQHFLSKHRYDGLQESGNLENQQLSSTLDIKEEPVDATYIESLPSSSQGHQNINGAKEKPYECPQCKLRFISNSGLGMHIRIHTTVYPFYCSKCNKGFWSKNVLHKHKRRCKGLEIISNMNSNEESPSELDLNDTVLVFNKGSKTTGTGVLQTKFSCKDQDNGDLEKGDTVVHKYQCSECDESFTDGLRLISHLEDHGREDLERRLGKKHQCHMCGKTFDQAGLLQRHLKSQHQESASVTCPECFRNFRCPSDLDLHRQCHDPNRPFVCNTCQLRFWSAKALRIHEGHAHPGTEHSKASETSAVETPKVFTCQPCNKTYTVKGSYLKHRRVKHNENSKSLDVPSGPVDEHLNINETDRTDTGNQDVSDEDSDSAPYFPCHVCGKTFLTSESLEDHQRCHLGEKPYECEECGKCFFQLVNLQQHQRSHKTEFQCQMCGKGFVSLFALRKHKHTHFTKRPHGCTKCHLSFTGSSQLAEHMLSHRDENFPCDLCNKTFSCKSSRAEHRKLHTEQEEELPSLIPPTRQTSPPTMMNSLSSNNAQQYKYRCGVCQVRFQDPEQLSEHGCNPAKERPYSCPECNKHFLHGSHLKKHQLSHHLSGPRSFQCKSCDMSFNQRHNFLNHLRRHHNEAPSDSRIDDKVKLTNTDDLNEDKIYKCPICPEKFSQALELASHLSVHSHMCSVCKKTFATKQQLEEHEQCHLSAATQYECTECGNSFLGSDAFRQHNCARQKRLFSDKNLRHSSKSPPRKKRFTGVSFKAISNERDEEEEEEVDVGEDFYNCPVCNKRFSSNNSLQEHQKLHEDGRPFKCLVCGKRFAKKKYLTAHQELHSEQPYRCEFCSESFKTEPKLLSHRKTHDATRTHQCLVCSKSYHTASALYKHAQKHPELQSSNEGSGDYRCDMCYKSFSMLSHLRKHQETHVGQVVYECTECDKAFAFLNLLEEHQQMHANVSHETEIDSSQLQTPSHILFQNQVVE